MVNDGRIEISGLTKRFGQVRAVNGLSFAAEPGRVTGFLGPNGSGKTTTLMMLLGLITPDEGTAVIGGVPYADLDRPALTVGSALEANFHPAHTAREHLDILRRAIGVPVSRVDEVLGFVGLEGAADRKTGGFSLGMRQRLSLAGALLGDPKVLVLDEPVNGLDPEGIRWIRVFLRHLASQGTTVLLSSHVLGEVQQTVDDLVIIREGTLAYAGTLDELQTTRGGSTVLVSAGQDPDTTRKLEHALRSAGIEVSEEGSGFLRARGTTSEDVGRVAFRSGLPLAHLSEERMNLEQSFLDLVDPQHASGVQDATAGA